MTRRCRALPPTDKITALHRSLAQAQISHAFGGALALAYYAEPRPTSDIDVNVFVPTSEWARVKNALSPLGVEVEVDEDELRRESQIWLGWNPNPLHLFFSSDPLHEEMERNIREVPFGDGTIPLVAPQHLVIRKTLLNRLKDQRDIEAIIAKTPVDQAKIDAWVERLSN